MRKTVKKNFLRRKIFGKKTQKRYFRKGEVGVEQPNGCRVERVLLSIYFHIKTLQLLTSQGKYCQKNAFSLFKKLIATQRSGKS